MKKKKKQIRALKGRKKFTNKNIPLRDILQTFFFV